jgi:hypothetical protein
VLLISRRDLTTPEHFPPFQEQRAFSPRTLHHHLQPVLSLLSTGVCASSLTRLRRSRTIRGRLVSDFFGIRPRTSGWPYGHSPDTVLRQSGPTSRPFCFYSSPWGLTCRIVSPVRRKFHLMRFLLDYRRSPPPSVPTPTLVPASNCLVAVRYR